MSLTPNLEIDIFKLRNYTQYNNYDFYKLDIIENSVIEYKDFFEKYMIKNIPCIIKNVSFNWKCTRKWVKNGGIHYEYIMEHYGNLKAPVADCNNIAYNSHCKCDMNVSDYMNYLNSDKKDRILYLKDWHLKRLRPNDRFYEVPLIFSSDWLNEYAEDHQDDDFMFVYIGPKDSWTPLHADVYCSYSWSVNITGKKKWILFPPGEESKIQGTSPSLPLLFDDQKCNNVKFFEVIQEEGDGIFVPSGWYHQVVNLLDTISINHNWINACNINYVWDAIQKNIKSVEHEIEEFRNTEEFASQCQLILKSVFGMDFEMFIKFFTYIGKKRIGQLHSGSFKGFGKSVYGMKHIVFDITTILALIDKIIIHPLYLSKNVISVETEKELLIVKDFILQELNKFESVQ